MCHSQENVCKNTYPLRLRPFNLVLLDLLSSTIINSNKHCIKWLSHKSNGSQSHTHLAHRKKQIQ